MKIYRIILLTAACLLFASEAFAQCGLPGTPACPKKKPTTPAAKTTKPVKPAPVVKNKPAVVAKKPLTVKDDPFSVTLEDVRRGFANFVARLSADASARVCFSVRRSEGHNYAGQSPQRFDEKKQR